MQTVKEYLETVTPSQHKEYVRIQKIVKKLVPEADEVISYGIPTFKYKGKYVLYFGAFKNHVSIFPGGNVDLFKDQLTKYKISKGTIKYNESDPIPEEIIRGLIINRMEALTSTK